MSAVLAIILVFVGCMSNVVFLELLVKEDPGIGNLITFLQFLFIAIEGVIFTYKFGTAKRNISLQAYAILVILFFLTSFLNNYAFDFNVPMPLHIIFRSGSLITNMAMGIYILNKQYPLSKYVSISMITSGIILCTLASGTDVKSTATRGPETTPFEDFLWWSVGIFILFLALVLSARMGIYQEVLYKRFGKHPREALFYTHALPLPLFFLGAPNLLSHWGYVLESTPMDILGFAVPSAIVYLAGNVLSQYMCISSVYTLTAECTSLVVTLVITLRKFASLIFSIYYFSNPFTLSHWLGTLLVFAGTVIFTELDKKCVELLPLVVDSVRGVRRKDESWAGAKGGRRGVRTGPNRKNQGPKKAKIRQAPKKVID